MSSYPLDTQALIAERVLVDGSRQTAIAIIRRQDEMWGVIRRWNRHHQLVTATPSLAGAVAAANTLLAEYLDGGWQGEDAPFTIADIAPHPRATPRPLSEELFE